MKNQVICSLAFFIFSMLHFSTANATTAVSAQEMRVGLAEKMRANPGSVVKKDSKSTKRFYRLAKRLGHKATKGGSPMDFSDPTDRWLWFGIVGLGIAIILAFLDAGIGGLVALLAIVCLIIWVVKRGAA